MDGFIARENGDIDWLENVESAPQEDYGYNSFLEQIDGIIMGRDTYEKVRTFRDWPYKCPVIVMSHTLCASDIPVGLKHQIEIMAGSPGDISNILVNRGWRSAYVDGGKLIQSFLNENMISEITITKLPILLGRGRPLFGNIQHDKLLHHLSTTSYPSGLVKSQYQLPLDN